ncbi:hypothetical protein GPALN_011911 [Globodera pallida]|nr:hypothetical protein GPALN_011911 [Globodera pallida]
METIKLILTQCVEMETDENANQDFHLSSDEPEQDERQRRLRELTNFSSSSSTSPVALVEKYLAASYSGRFSGSTALSFWEKVKNDPDKKLLLRSALSYLAIPSTTAPVERVFSCAGIMTKGLKNRTQEKLLSRKLMVHLNKLHLK